MRHYEILLMIHPDQGDQVANMIERYTSIVLKSGGKIHRQEDWGKVPLAYQINKLHKAYYVLLNIECSQNTIEELNNSFKFNDAVIRKLVVKCDFAITEQSSFLKNKDQDKNNKSSGFNVNNGYYNIPKEQEEIVHQDNAAVMDQDDSKTSI